jgi:hypothetical protein
MFRGKQIYEPLFSGARVTNGDFLGVLFMAIVSSFVRAAPSHACPR